jgi:general secretion pathway protein D
VGDEFTLRIQADQARDLYSAPFYLQYDPQTLEFINLAEGKFLNQDGKPTAFIYSVQPDTGLIIVGLSRLGEIAGVSGSGILALATFRAKNPGQATIAFQNVDFRDARFEQIPMVFETNEIQIR